MHGQSGGAQEGSGGWWCHYRTTAELSPPHRGSDAEPGGGERERNTLFKSFFENIHVNKLFVLQLWSSWDNKDSLFMCHEAFWFVVSSFSKNDLFSGCSWSNWWPWRGNSFQERMLILECFQIVLSPSDTFVFFLSNNQRSKDVNCNYFFFCKKKKQWLLPILVLYIPLWFVIRCDWFALNSCSNLLLLWCLKIIQTVWDLTCVLKLQETYWELNRLTY